MKISRAAGRTVRVKYLVGSSKCLSRLKNLSKNIPPGNFQRGRRCGEGVRFLRPPPMLLIIHNGALDKRCAI